MRDMFCKLPFILFLFLFTATPVATASEIHVAAASNFMGALRTITEIFEAQTGNRIVPIYGSTGKHFAQIKNGAPFDAFFAADTERPQLLEELGLAIRGSRFTYAIGKIVLWSPRPGYVDENGTVLGLGSYRFLSIANPRLAPYGAAARQVLQAGGLWDLIKQRIVRGENITQAYQFVASGNAELGFVALSQIQHSGKAIQGSYWVVPQQMYPPIEQQAVLLREKPPARAFLDFVKSARVKKIIERYGYAVPP